MAKRKANVNSKNFGKDMVAKLKVYEVGYMVNDQMKVDHLEATSVFVDGDDLLVYEKVAGEDDEQIGGFKNWCYFRVVRPTSCM